MPMGDSTLKQEGRFKYIETSESKEVILLLHGLFGALSNFKDLIAFFGNDYNVVVPILPIYDLSIKETGLDGLLSYTEDFIAYKKYDKIHLLGNSLGGHIAQLYALKHPDKIASLILTGSSGLFESGMGDGYPRRGDYDYIRKKTELTFYDPAIATNELVDEVFETVNNREKALRIVVTARSALMHNLSEELKNIVAPVLLVWGNQDTITPPFVGEKCHELLINSKLVFMDKCGHAPMMELPDEFNSVLSDFLSTV